MVYSQSPDRMIFGCLFQDHRIRCFDWSELEIEVLNVGVARRKDEGTDIVGFFKILQVGIRYVVPEILNAVSLGRKNLLVSGECG